MSPAHGHAEEPSRESLAAFALGSLEGAEAVELERHVAGCERCREYLRWLSPAVDLLPASVEQMRPSPRVREVILAEVRADAAAAEPRRAARRRSWWQSPVLRPATALAVVALVVAGVAGYLLRGSGSSERTTVAAIPTPAAPAGQVDASLEVAGGTGTLVIHDLPRLPRNRVYEVWAQRGNRMVPQSTFVLRRDGSANAAVPGPLDGVSAVLVTSEPRGGSDAPTSAPLLRAPLD